MLTFHHRSVTGGKGAINAELVQQLESEKRYWREVLKRVIAVIQFLSERGLAFRGDNELLGSPHNGNFLGMLEVISKFDQFLAFS